ncbi:MAG: DUF4149 domain-containing protein [Mariprofundaceae bacterium]
MIHLLQVGFIRLLLSLILGLLIVPGYIIAPILFSVAPTVHEAGNYAGHIFHVTNLASLVVGLLLAICWWTVSDYKTSRSCWWTLLATVLLIAINEFAIANVLAQLKAEVGGNMRALSAESPQRLLFGRWHGVSALLHLIASCACVTLVIRWPSEREICSS